MEGIKLQQPFLKCYLLGIGLHAIIKMALVTPKKDPQ
jgi:Ras-related protein Rab-8A